MWSTQLNKSEFKKIQKDVVTPFLQRHNFIKDGNSYFKTQNNITNFIEFEFSRFNTVVFYSFNINFSIWCGNFEKNYKKKRDIVLNSTPVFSQKDSSYFNDARNLGFNYNVDEKTLSELPGYLIKDLELILNFSENYFDFDSLIEFIFKDELHIKDKSTDYYFFIGLGLAKLNRKEEAKQFLLKSENASPEIIQRIIGG